MWKWYNESAFITAPCESTSVMNSKISGDVIFKSDNFHIIFNWLFVYLFIYLFFILFSYSLLFIGSLWNQPATVSVPMKLTRWLSAGELIFFLFRSIVSTVRCWHKAALIRCKLCILLIDLLVFCDVPYIYCKLL